MIWTYWDNSQQWHGKKLFTVKAKTITEANDAFTKETGIILMKNTDITIQQNEE